MRKWEFKKLIRDWKTRILLAGIFLFYATFSLFYQQQSVRFPEDAMKRQYDQIHLLFNTIPKSDFSGEVGEEVYDRLADLQMLYGMQLFILTRKEGNTVSGLEDIFSDYLEYGTQIAAHQERLMELESFPYYTYMSTFLPDEATIQRDVAFYDYMERYDLDYEWNSFSASSILKEQVQFIVGFVLFLFVALLASDRFTKDQTKNWSVTQGIPIPVVKQWHTKAISLWSLLWGTTIVGVVTSYTLNRFIETSGSLLYPVMVLFPTGYQSIPLILYAVLLIIFGMVLSYCLLLLSLGLSWMIRTVYLTIALSIAPYFIPMVWTIVQPFSSFQPSFYLHIESVFTGEWADQTGLEGIHFVKGIFILLLFSILLHLLFTRVFTAIQTKSFGLKRRTTT